MPSELIYLASPYSHSDDGVRESRFRDICVIASRLMERGYHVFSPIAHTHPIATYGFLATGFDRWKLLDELMLSKCDKFLIAIIGGWKESVGLKAELQWWLLHRTNWTSPNDSIGCVSVDGKPTWSDAIAKELFPAGGK